MKTVDPLEHLPGNTRDCPRKETASNLDDALERTPPSRWTQEQQTRWLETHSGILQGAIRSFQYSYEKEDLMQMALETALVCFHRYRKESDTQLTTYVYQSIRNNLNMMARSERAQKRSADLVSIRMEESSDSPGIYLDSLEVLPSDPFRSWDPGVEEQVLRREQVDYRNSLLRRTLNPTESLCFCMHMDGLTRQEISRRTGLSAHRITTTLSRARLRLAEAIVADGILDVKEEYLQQMRQERRMQEQEDLLDDLYGGA